MGTTGGPWACSECLRCTVRSLRDGSWRLPFGQALRANGRILGGPRAALGPVRGERSARQQPAAVAPVLSLGPHARWPPFCRDDRTVHRRPRSQRGGEHPPAGGRGGGRGGTAG